ncbi:MAG TPA: tRNA pseudouridine(38-40) synthase TruA [Terracidiphilus sp.]|jgi:tRNA pseudouridine38-40 synthase|nr:tRNA pseudouridine(38-40) synthase TruA [Terracidiphilus sp.]
MDSEQSAPGMQTWKLTLAYDGSDYHGWQVQPGLPTIQGELQAALDRVTGEAPLPQGSGRTDAGVHALGQVASFALTAPIPEENLVRAVNRTLPGAIRILEARIMPQSFHARHATVAKTYEYRVLLDPTGHWNGCSPFVARYVHAFPWRMDRAALHAAARCFAGEHDFTSFAATDPDLAERTRDVDQSEDGMAGTAGAVRTIFSSEWCEDAVEGGTLLVYRVRGNGFLHHMVRNLVGTMIDVGRGQIRVEEIPGILAARSRPSAGPTAPARGLFLHSVEYGPEFD